MWTEVLARFEKKTPASVMTKLILEQAVPAEWVDPVEALGLLAPEAVGVDDRLLVYGLVGRLVGQRVGQNLGTNGIQGSRTHLSCLGE